MAKKEYKQLSCRDFGADCDFLVRAETEEEVLRVAADHGCRMHGECENSAELKEKARSLIKNVAV
jgi:predicted small metal-binding protein